MGSMTGWAGNHEPGKRPRGVHPLASVGGPPEHRGWMVGDPTLQPNISASALVHAFCTIDAGMTYRETTTVGERSFLQARVHLGHNAVVGADCELCAGVVICGEVTIGDGVHIGGNSWVKPLVTIGDGAIIGGGSVVTKDVPAHEVWAGNPARYMKLAWTHPQMRGFTGRVAAKPQYAMTDDEWETARDTAEQRRQESEEVWAIESGKS